MSFFKEEFRNIFNAVTTKYLAMNDQTLRIIMWVGAILFSIIGFFVVRYINRTSKKQDENAESINATYKELSASINKLQIAITGLNGIILSMQDKNDIFTTGCKDKHGALDKTLHIHDKRLNEHEKKIVALEVKVGG